MKYNSTDKTVIVRTPSGQENFKTLMSGDLVKARAIALQTPSTLADKKIEASGEGHYILYTFPMGEALRYQIQYKGLINYTEINSDGIAVVKWQIDTTGNNGEVGKKPEDFDEYVFFRFDYMIEKLTYGTVDNKGTSTDLGVNDFNLNKELRDVIIMPIEGEVRTDLKT